MAGDLETLSERIADLLRQIDRKKTEIAEHRHELERFIALLGDLEERIEDQKGGTHAAPTSQRPPGTSRESQPNRTTELHGVARRICS